MIQKQFNLIQCAGRMLLSRSRDHRGRARFVRAKEPETKIINNNDPISVQRIYGDARIIDIRHEKEINLSQLQRT